MSVCRKIVLGLILVLASATGAHAEDNPNALPNSLSFGAGWHEIRDNNPYVNGGDFRLEHRWGLSLLSATSDFFQPLDSGFQIHPFMGVETSTRVEFYGFGGLILDFLVGRNIVISPNFALGYYSQGEGKRLGCLLEFRSTMEAGVRLNNEWRVTGYVSHISNAHLGRKNPGVEMAGVYLHIPLGK